MKIIRIQTDPKLLTVNSDELGHGGEKRFLTPQGSWLRPCSKKDEPEENMHVYFR